MKLIIAGSRDLSPTVTDLEYLFNIIIGGVDNKRFKEIVSGCAKGVDTSGELLAKKYQIPIKKFKADWDKYGKAAGPIRNKMMADYADMAIILINDLSKGSLNMIQHMNSLNKPHIIYFFQNSKYVNYKVVGKIGTNSSKI